MFTLLLVASELFLLLFDFIVRIIVDDGLMDLSQQHATDEGEDTDCETDPLVHDKA